MAVSNETGGSLFGSLAGIGGGLAQIPAARQLSQRTTPIRLTSMLPGVLLAIAGLIVGSFMLPTS